ncbi:PAS domain-containing sensor histidine kinase [Sphingobacterium paramultivorum]|uniref:histidine kinase n=1 Tax=Sphingobacterium paramultivorum TaxID=2886510 RepID=A0A7G5DZM3_9SPHI|nr:PAS domain-containing sensor histidine kinase [Sphingobacterium paramultivorum]QMV67198.1 PAS domain-containing sensor histidine kinase [Sphingobacterium paramultivorum]WSO16050.1 PAS domain-containing sensor histidine kinase [Sphingobacterium paramultivorum]
MINLHGADSTFTVSQKHLAQALAQARIGFWEVSLREKNYMSCTDQCKRNFGWDTAKDFSYSDMLGCIVNEDREAMQASVTRAIERHVPYTAQYRVRHGDDSIHWIEARGWVTYDENGCPQVISGTTLDITEKKELEILRDEMLSIAMHEIKTPLSSVKGTLQILDRQLAGQENALSNKLVQNAVKATDRINRLLNEMVAPVMVMAKGIELDKSKIDLTQLILEISQNAALIFPDSDIHLHLPDDSVFLEADGYRIGQVIANLINNAIKYSDKKSPVHITMTADQHAVSVLVSDLGMGIKPEDRKKVFEKFYRSNGHNHIEGFGIGLFLCADIILRHGGQIHVLDKEGPGTDIAFTLPHK